MTDLTDIRDELAAEREHKRRTTFRCCSGMCGQWDCERCYGAIPVSVQEEQPKLKP